MDGLAGGIALIAALYLGFLFTYQGDAQHVVLALALAGAVGGFLCHNFHPASIFMGDAGSLFLGRGAQPAHDARQRSGLQHPFPGRHTNLYLARAHSGYRRS